MLLPLLLLAADTDPASVYSGRDGRLDVHPPRLEAEVKVDGKLDEPAWAEAAMLTGFSQFTPVDGIPAADSTEVLVWYSATAIYFGIRAFEAHGQVHATLADRDKIDVGRQRPDPARHLRRWAAGVDVRGQSARGAVGRGAGRDRVDQRQRVQQRGGQAGERRPEPGLRVRVQGAAHRLRLRGRGPDSVQEPPLPAGEGAALGHQHHPPGPALGAPRIPGRRPSGRARRSSASRVTWWDSPICGAGWCSSSTRL